MTVEKELILKLYKSLLREGNKFSSYNFRYFFKIDLQGLQNKIYNLIKIIGCTRFVELEADLKRKK